MIDALNLKSSTMSFAIPTCQQAVLRPRRLSALTVSWRAGGAIRLLLLVASLCLGLGGCANPAAAPPNSAQLPGKSYTIGLYPMAAYDQNVDHWIAPAGSDYDQPFLSAEEQRAHFKALYARYFGVGANAPSPWNPVDVDANVYRQAGRDIAALQRQRIAWFDNRGKTGGRIGYGGNFHPHTPDWIDAIARNMDLGQFERTPSYTPARRAIATGNLLVRELPTLDPSFYDPHLAGEGYPFDNLQISAIHPGTPLYVLGSSLDGAWRYVQTPDVQGWVRSEDVSRVNDAFIDTWRHLTRQTLGVVIEASVPVRDNQAVFRFDAPAGTLLPVRAPAVSGSFDVWLPVRDVEGQAVIRSAQLSDTQIAPMPLSATPRHLAMLLKTLIGRPYGWGNSGLYNDCSSELQSIFVTFGVWLPRHSSNQMSAGPMVDLSDATLAQRLDYLVHHGKPMRTLIYIGGHVMLYLGNITRDQQLVPLVYQDVWGLRPADNSRRAVIGGSVILPLLAGIPEDPALASLAATPIFQLSIIGAPVAGVAVPSDDDANPAS